MQRSLGCCHCQGKNTLHVFKDPVAARNNAGVEMHLHLTLYQTIPTFNKKPFESIVGKGENAGNHFSFSRNVFYQT